MSLNLSFIKYEDSHSGIWESINQSSNSSFLTSIDWINFQKSLRKEIEMYLIQYNQEFIGNFYIEIFRRKLAKYAYSPYGPVINFSKINEGGNVFADVFNEIKNWEFNFAKERNLNCFRIDPLVSANNLKILESVGFVKSMAPTQAKYVWQIDIQKDEEHLLADMKKVARYNIRNSVKVGIKVEKASTLEQVKEFYKILNSTTQRHDFASFSEDYFIKQFEYLKNSMFNLYLAKLNGQYISGALINTYNNIGYYSHGGSVNNKEIQKYGASYLLHWEIIKDLKQKGFVTYNMWGIIPEGKSVNNGMKGVSEFKKRFGGSEFDYVGGLDIPTSANYKLQRLMEAYIYRKDRY